MQHISGTHISGTSCPLAIKEVEEQASEELLVATPGVIFPVQNLHRKMMRLKTLYATSSTTSNTPVKRA
jgi:hypothetical protein